MINNFAPFIKPTGVMAYSIMPNNPKQAFVTSKSQLGISEF